MHRKILVDMHDAEFSLGQMRDEGNSECEQLDGERWQRMQSLSLRTCVWLVVGIGGLRSLVCGVLQFDWFAVTCPASPFRSLGDVTRDWACVWDECLGKQMRMWKGWQCVGRGDERSILLGLCVTEIGFFSVWRPWGCGESLCLGEVR